MFLETLVSGYKCPMLPLQNKEKSLQVLFVCQFLPDGAAQSQRTLLRKDSRASVFGCGPHYIPPAAQNFSLFEKEIPTFVDGPLPVRQLSHVANRATMRSPPPGQISRKMGKIAKQSILCI